MEITFWGVRGSYPVPGRATIRYGGQTSCVEVRTASGSSLIVDAGTGLRALGQKLAREGVRRSHHILLSHVHWDHIQGLPFFEPMYASGNNVEVYALLTAADELQQVIGGITRHEFFPVPLEAVPAEINFHEVDPGLPMLVEDVTVLPFALNHPFGSVGYRMDADGTSVAYVSDTAPFTEVLHKQHFLPGLETLTDEDKRVLGDMRGALVNALKGVDTVIYDTHFLPEEYARFPHYGHSTPDQALEIVANNEVRRLILYHHAPSHTDDQMDDIAARYREKGASMGVDVITACEGMVLTVGPVKGAKEAAP
jgi:phosphoribosyl 1,2-cyclic phosphodiesterase